MNDDFYAPKVSASGGCEVFDPYQDVSMGTSIFACKYKDGVVLCADSRTSMGTYVANRTSNKLTQISDRIFCCRSGSAADTQAIAEMVAHYMDQHSMEKGAPPATKTAAKLFQQLCYHNRNMLSAGIIVGGWDKLNGGSVWSVPIGGALIEQDYCIGGSGSTYIYAWCDEHYKPDMTEEEALAFCRGGIAHAMARDGSSGGVIRSVVINEAGAKDHTVAWGEGPYALETDKRIQKLINPAAAVTVSA
jgi:20S proteasome subunit beta 1